MKCVFKRAPHRNVKILIDDQVDPHNIQELLIVNGTFLKKEKRLSLTTVLSASVEVSAKAALSSILVSPNDGFGLHS